MQPDVFESDSDAIIATLGEMYGVDPDNLAGLRYYKDNLFKAYIENFKELKALREEISNA